MSSSAITGPIFTDVRRSPSGTAAAPSWSFNASQGTGVYLVSADVLGLSTAGVQRVVVDSAGNVGIGGTPSAWGSSFRIIEVGSGSGCGWMANASGISQSWFSGNAYYDGSIWRYKNNGAAKLSVIDAPNGNFTWNHANSGTAGNTLTFTEHMRLDASGALTVGPSSGLTTAHIIQNSKSDYRVLTVKSSFGDASRIFFEGTTSSIQVGLDSGGQAVFTGISGKTASGGSTVYVTGGGLLGTSTSIREAKVNINPLESPMNWLMQLKPYTFQYRKQNEKNEYTDEAHDFVVTGLIYDEVKPINPGLCFDTEDGKPSGVEYTRLITPMLKAIQELSAKNDALEARLAALESK